VCFLPYFLYYLLIHYCSIFLYYGIINLLITKGQIIKLISCFGGIRIKIICVEEIVMEVDVWLVKLEKFC
jgi:hypothetical protein